MLGLEIAMPCSKLIAWRQAFCWSWRLNTYIKTLKLPINVRKGTTTMDATYGFNINSIHFNDV